MLTLARPHRTEQADGQSEERAQELARVLLQHPTLRVRCATAPLLLGMWVPLPSMLEGGAGCGSCREQA